MSRKQPVRKTTEEKSNTSIQQRTCQMQMTLAWAPLHAQQKLLCWTRCDLQSFQPHTGKQGMKTKSDGAPWCVHHA